MAPRQKQERRQEQKPLLLEDGSIAPPYVFVAADMDGTLLRDDHMMSPAVRAVIHKIAYEKRLPFIIATGRPHQNALHIIRNLLRLHRCYVVTSNGARVHNMQGELVFSADIDEEAARAIATLACPSNTGEVDEFADVATSIYQGDRWFMNKDAEDLTEFYKDLRSLFYYELFDPARHERYDGVYKVYFTSRTDRSALEKIAARIKRLPCARDVNVVFSLPYCLEVMPGNVDKGTAVARLLDKVIVPNSDPSGKLSETQRQQRLLSKCIAFGDGGNDLRLLTMAGKGCVMANATSDLKAQVTAYLKANRETPGPAGHIEFVKSNEEDGVARKLQEVFQFTDEQLARANRPLLPKWVKTCGVQLLVLVVLFLLVRPFCV